MEGLYLFSRTVADIALQLIHSGLLSRSLDKAAAYVILRKSNSRTPYRTLSDISPWTMMLVRTLGLVYIRLVIAWV